MTAKDGRKRFTDVANTEQLLRIIQSIPSKKLPEPGQACQQDSTRILRGSKKKT